MARVECVVRKGEYTKSWTGSARQSTGMSITSSRVRQDDDPEAVQQQEHRSIRRLNVP